ncbi:hypothetical protein D9758_009458 [Tetrapyrgos nigripes]|uniref:Uncharacterized protein n=1 Tax=Tetrapyrgos nigripes TaxID=182062 RepID=A0A8H5D2J8_9AGAR|nr:hypothetical protein D9758_009458 [Tetrapyrgos nigripes]
MSVQEITQKLQNLDLAAEDINKLPVSEELNNFLTLDYMISHKPWEDLPWIYFPSQYNRHPPLFFYGFGLTHEEVLQYAIDEGLSDFKSCKQLFENSTAAGDAFTAALKHMKAKYKVGRRMMTIERAASLHAHLVLAFWDNYATSVPNYEQVNDVIDTIEVDYGPPAWYLANTQDLHERDYGLKFSKKAG